MIIVFETVCYHLRTIMYYLFVGDCLLSFENYYVLLIETIYDHCKTCYLLRLLFCVDYDMFYLFYDHCCYLLRL